MTEAGRLELILGPMFSGKTTELLRRLRIQDIAQRSVKLLKYDLDDRYQKNAVVSHDMESRLAESCSTLLPRVETIDEDVVGIDEGQFFPDIVEACVYLVEKGKTVYVSSLDGDFLKCPFGQIVKLISHADSFQKYTAVCRRCRTHPGIFTSKKTKGNNALVEIGGTDLYEPTCRSCYTSPYEAP